MLDQLLKFPNVKKFKSIAVTQNDITDNGLMMLKSLEQLVMLQVGGTKVTQSGIEQFHQSVPNCRIFWDGGVVEPIR